MARRQRNSRPDRPSEERSLDALLEGGPLPDGDQARWRAVGQVLTALTSVPESSELSGEARALAEFRVRPVHGAEPARASRSSRVTWLRGVTWVRGPRPALAAATGGVLIGGLLAVAYAGDLPAAAQRLAHDTIDAPAAGRPNPARPEPGSSSLLATSAGHSSARSGHGSPQPDRQTPRGSTSAFPRHHRSSGGPSGAAGGRPSGHREPGHQGSGSPGQGSPGPGSSGPGSPGPSGSPTQSPTPTQQPSPSASLAPSPSASLVPSAGATSTPSAGSQAAGRPRHHRHPGSASTSSSPP